MFTLISILAVIIIATIITIFVFGIPVAVIVFVAGDIAVSVAFFVWLIKKIFCGKKEN